MAVFTTMCSSRKYPYPLPPQGGQGKFRGEGGSKKETIAEGAGVAYSRFFPRGLMKIGELLIIYSFSVEQAFSYFTVIGLQNKYYCLDWSSFT